MKWILDAGYWILNCIQPRRSDNSLNEKDTFLKNHVGVTQGKKAIDAEFGKESLTLCKYSVSYFLRKINS